MRYSTALTQGACRARLMQDRARPPGLALGVAITCLLVLTSAFASPASGAAAVSSTKSPWSLQAQFGRLYEAPAAVSCPSAVDCYGLSLAPNNGERLLVSTNGGTTWAAAGFPVGFVGTGLSCPMAKTCLIAGVPGSTARVASDLYLTRTSGASWSALSPSNLLIEGLTCHSSTFCVAGGETPSGSIQTLVSTNLGGTWTVARGLGKEFVSPSCPSTSDCFALDGHAGLEVTTNGARAWKSVPLPAIAGMRLDALSCATAQHCVAVGGVSTSTGGRLALVSGNGGKSWSKSFTRAPTSSLLEVSCASASHCVAISAASLSRLDVSLGADVSTDGGLSWKAYPVAISEDALTALFFLFTGWNPASLLTCPTVSRCVTAGEMDDFTTRLMASGTGGTSWKAGGLPGGALPYSLACWSAGCVAGAFTNSGSMTEVSTNALTWSSHRIPFAAVADGKCVATQTCDALAFTTTGELRFVRTTDGGATWKDLFDLGGTVTSGGASLACPSAKVCYVAIGYLNLAHLKVATRAYRTANGGTSWKRLDIPASFASTLDQIACPSTTTCVLTNHSSAEVSKDAGAAWSPSHIPSGTALLTEASCGSSTSCMMMADVNGTVAALVTTDSGTAWKTAAALPTAVDAADATAVACASATDCEVVGESPSGVLVGFFTSDRGRSFRQQLAPSSLGKGGGWGPLACLADSRCEAAAVGASGDGYLLGLG